MPINQDPISLRISRRVVLGTAAAMAATPALAELCPIGPPKHDKGPLVWMEMDQVELDAAYDQSVYAPLIGQIQKRFATSSNEARARLGAPKRLAYGPTPVEGLDLYPAKAPNAPIFVYIHGGAWRGGEAKDYGFPAELFVNAGVNFIVLDFMAVGAANGDIGVMAEQVRRAIAWTYKNAASFSGDTNRFYIGGDSVRRPSLRCCSGDRLAKRLRTAGRYGERRTLHERHVRHEAGASLQAQLLCQIHRRHGAGDEFATAARPVACPHHRHLRHQRDAGIPTSEPRFRRRGESGRQAD